MSEVKRYPKIIVLLHWTMALCFLAMIISGLLMVDSDIPKLWKFRLYQWHKALGLLLMVAAFIRLAIKLVSLAPPMLKMFSLWEQRIIKLGHWVFYVWMVTLPLTGWIMVSSSPIGLPTFIFGWFEWPHIAYVQNSEVAHTISNVVHWIMAWLFIGLIAGHIGAVIRHRYKDGINLLPRMWFR